MKAKLSVGQKVYFLGNNHYSRNSNNELIEMTVSSVGKKYFELEEMPRERFYIETLRHDRRNYMPIGIVYLNAEDYYEEKRLSKATYDIKEFFTSNPSKYMDKDTIYQIYNLVMDARKNNTLT